MPVTFQLLSTLFTGFFAKKKPEAKRNLWTSNEVKNSGLGWILNYMSINYIK